MNISSLESGEGQQMQPTTGRMSLNWFAYNRQAIQINVKN